MRPQPASHCRPSARPVRRARNARRAAILISVVAIGLITFALSTAGVMIGRAGAKALGSQAEIIGGLILIVIGAKVLIDHKAFG